MADSERLPAPSADERATWAAALGDADLHRRLVDELPCLQRAEVVQPSAGGSSLTGWVRLGAWNLERGKEPDPSAALMRRCAADVWLLSELDSGMARTGNRDVAAELAERLGRAGHAYGVEFVELARGKAGEEPADGRDNERAFHGNGIISSAELSDVEVVRLDGGGEWFAADSSEPRVDTRMAVVAAVQIDGREVDLATVHLENQSDGARRAAQLEVLLARLDERGTGRPAVIGGDLNTFGAEWSELFSPRRVRQLRADEPTRFTWPVPHEPLFEAAAGRGFRWEAANVAAPTTRHGPDGLPDHVPMRLDWLLVRGLDAGRPAVVPALGDDGRPLSDHDIVAVSVRLPR